jgi:hypothetical protein
MTIPAKTARLGKILRFNATTGNPEAVSATDVIASGAFNVYNFTGDGTTVAFVLGIAPISENNTQVYIDGVYQQKNTYTVSSTTLTFSAAPPNLSTIEVMVVTALPVGATTASQVSFTQAGSTSGRNVQLKLQESVSVLDFGADSTGVADSTAAIQSAFNSGANGVFFPSGTYLVNNVSTVNNLTITGSGSSILKLFGAATVAIRSVGDNVSISRLSFDLDDVTNSIGINDGGGESVSIQNCKFYDHTIALNINSTGNQIRFIDNEVFGGGYGVLVNSSASGSDLIISNNTFDGRWVGAGTPNLVNRDAIEINLPSGNFPYINISDNVIRNYDSGSASSGFGIGVAGGKHVSISNNVVNNCGQQGIHVEDDSRFVSIIGNVVSNSGSGTNTPANEGIGIAIYEVYHSSVEDNIVYNSADSGIRSSSGTVARHCSIENNLSYENGNHGIELITPRFFTVLGNNCKNNAVSGIEMTGPARSVFSNNFCYNEANPLSPLYTQVNGIKVTGTPTNTVFMNNTCYDNTNDFVGVASSSTVMAAFNNLIDNAVQPATRTYTITNVSTDRAFDADSTTTAELADVLGTLIADLTEKGIIS